MFSGFFEMISKFNNAAFSSDVKINSFVSLNEELKSFLAMNEEEINGRLVNQSTILASQHSLQTFPNRIRQQFNALG